MLQRTGPKIDHMLSRHPFEAFALGLNGIPGFLIGTVLVNGSLSEIEFRKAGRQHPAAGVSCDSECANRTSLLNDIS